LKPHAHRTGRTPHAARPTRRVALSLGLGGLAAAALPARAGARLETSSAPSTLVVLQLTGGNDGLSTLVPHGDDAYHAARPTVARKGDQVLPLDDYRGLHSGLARLRAHYDAGRLALVQGVGYERPSRSHFRSMEVWHAADRAGKAAGEGWLGRLAAGLGPEPAPLGLVHLGKRLPFSLHSRRHPAVAFHAPEVYRWVEHGAVLGAQADHAASVEAGTGVLAALRRTARDARASSEAVRAAVAGHEPAVEYPGTELARQLRIAAALIHGEVGLRVLSLEHPGYDHHNDLRRRHDRKMATLDAALDAFVRDLAASETGRRSAVLVFSEFGRRVAENGSRGTDHGKAGLAFVLGHPVRGGLYGEHPSLTALADGDLPHTTDFRRVYAGVARGLFGHPASDLLPREAAALDLLRLSV